MSRFTDTMYENARRSTKGLITGEPDAPLRQSWAEVHERARQIAGGLAAAGIGPGDAVAVLTSPRPAPTWCAGPKRPPPSSR